ncbi:MAG: hypothetical protein Q8P42_08675 [Gallionella sp.]|nr:hypothetical protein [Gallionella sp.]
MAQINMKYSYTANAFIKTLGLTLMLSGLAQAAEKSEAGWEQTASTPDFTAYLNKQSITREGSHVKYWVRKDFLAPQVSDEGPDFVRDQSLYAADCSARSVALASTIRYSKSGSVIKRVSKLANELKFETPLSESLEAAHLKRVCGSR